MLKNKWKSLLLSSLALVMLVGCGSKAETPNKGEDKPAEKFELTVWTHPYVDSSLSDQQKKVFDDMAAEFKKTYPEANIVFEEIPWANREEKMLAALATDGGPDVFYLIPDMMTQFAEKGVLGKFDELLGKDFDFKDFTETSMEAVTYDGHIYGLPILRTVETMYYNTDILKEVGGDPEKLPTTWAEFNALADKAVEKGYYARNFEGGNTLNSTLYPYIWQAGGDIIKGKDEVVINSANSVKAFEEVMRQYKAGYFPEDAINGPDHSPYFLEGKMLAVSAAATMVNVAADAGFENYVIGPPLENTTYGTTGMFVVNAKSPNKEKAAELVSVMTNTENQRAFNKLTKYFPSRTSALDIYADDAKMAQMGEYVPYAKAGVIHYAARVFMPNVRAKLQAMMEGTLTPQQAADEAVQMIKNEF